MAGRVLGWGVPTLAGGTYLGWGGYLPWLGGYPPWRGGYPHGCGHTNKLKLLPPPILWMRAVKILVTSGGTLVNVCNYNVCWKIITQTLRYLWIHNTNVCLHETIADITCEKKNMLTPVWSHFSENDINNAETLTADKEDSIYVNIINLKLDQLFL